MTEDNAGPSPEPLGSRYLPGTAISGAMGHVRRGASRDGEPLAIESPLPGLTTAAATG
jgi:hypothetical protein